MRTILKISILFVSILILSSFTLQAQIYVKKDTIITYNVTPINGSNIASYNWTVSPGGSTSVLGTAASQAVTWDGTDGTQYTLEVYPLSVDGCNGDVKNLTVQLYTNPVVLPVTVAWGPDPAAQCAPGSASATVSSDLTVTGYAGAYTVTYKVDNGSTTDVPLNTVGSNTITISSSLDNTSNSTNATHSVRIMRIVAGTVTQLYTDANAPRLTVVINAVPAISDIQF